MSFPRTRWRSPKGSGSGLAKVTTVMLLVAAAHNLLRWVTLAR